MAEKFETPRRASGVRHTDEHSLLVDSFAGYGERVMRTWTCTCGDFTTRNYDSPARSAYRRHVKSAH